MHVIMRHQISGLRDGAFWPAIGESIDLPDDEAASLIDGGAAIAVSDADEDVEDVEAPVETATADVPVETAVKPGPAGK